MLDCRWTGAAKGYLELACPPQHQEGGIGAFVVHGPQFCDPLFRRRRRLRQIKGQIEKAASRGERCSYGGLYGCHTTRRSTDLQRNSAKNKGAPVRILGLLQL